jgi:hypothetical protein
MTTPSKMVEVWSDGSGGFRAVPATFAADTSDQWFLIRGNHDFAIFDLELASTAPATYVEAQLILSPDMGETPLGPIDIENTKSAGVSERQDASFRHLSTADGHHSISVDGLAQGMTYLLKLQVTGGTAVTARVYAYLGDS